MNEGESGDCVARNKDANFEDFLSGDVFGNFTGTSIITEDNFEKHPSRTTCPEGEPINLKPYLRDNRKKHLF